MYLELSKARLSSLVVLTTAVGYVMATPAGGVINWKRLLVTVVGTAFAAACANAFNQVVETRRDGLMERTRRRPLPSGSLGARHATLFALATGYAGIGTLAYAVSVDAAMLALLTILLYIGVYTPLKTRSPLNTLAGAVCGAIPPMIGWEAAAGTLGPGAWILAGVLFAWQLPHFFALAWRYREDYARGGFAMLSVRDRSGRLTALAALAASSALVPISLGATWWNVSGRLYAAGCLLLGGCLVALSIGLWIRRSETRARRLFLATLVYLPLLLCLMVVDRTPLAMAG
jgi:protoheme IX farnesyltransferase